MDITRVRVPGPRELRLCGSGVLHSEQQSCYEMGYREGVAAARRAIRERLSGVGQQHGRVCIPCPGTCGTARPEDCKIVRARGA
jgi:hypothetical protein